MSSRGDWDDARLNAAFRARFDAASPAALFDLVHERLEAGTPPRTRRWPGWPSLSMRFVAAPIVVVAIAFVVIVSTFVGGPKPSPTSTAPSATEASVAPTARPTDASELFDPAGPPPPAAITVPGQDREQPVLTVTEALERPASEPADREIVVGGWYSFIPVPCAAIPDATSELESCAVDFTWLMEDPQSVTAGARPTGPAINIVTAVTDWQPPISNGPVAIVVIGHFDDRRAAECPAGDRQARCTALFVVDAPLWTADGSITPGAAPNTGVVGGPFSVAEAIEWRDTRNFAAELAVAGWYNAPTSPQCYSTDGTPRWLVGICEDADRWLMAEPEQLLIIDGTTETEQTETHLTPTAAAFQVAFATTPAPHGNGIPRDIGARLPMPVVFFGHFHDRRSALCSSYAEPSVKAAQAACSARFVVDAVTWANGTVREPSISDWRETDGLPQPDVDVDAVVQQAYPNARILNQTLISGEFGLPMYEPRIAAKYPALASEPSLWAVTVRPAPPNPCTGDVCLTIAYLNRVIVLVIGPDGQTYTDLEFDAPAS